MAQAHSLISVGLLTIVRPDQIDILLLGPCWVKILPKNEPSWQGSSLKQQAVLAKSTVKNNYCADFVFFFPSHPGHVFWANSSSMAYFEHKNKFYTLKC